MLKMFKKCFSFLLIIYLIYVVILVNYIYSQNRTPNEDGMKFLILTNRLYIKKIFENYTNVNNDLKQKFTINSSIKVPKYKRISSRMKPQCEIKRVLNKVIPIDISAPPTLSDLHLNFTWLDIGGQWKPRKCHTAEKIAIIIPFEKSEATNLRIFLKHIHPLLRKQERNYRLFVIEQANDGPFHKGRLMNSGFLEAMKVDYFDCIVFHDVRLISIDETYMYSCDEQCPSILMNNIFTLLMIRVNQFRKLNGYSNDMIYLNNEATNMYKRSLDSGIFGGICFKEISRYIKLPYQQIETTQVQYKKAKHFDGLNGIKYEVKRIDNNLLYSSYLIDVE